MYTYIKIYEKFLGKKIYLIFLFSITAALMEAFGLILVIPILAEISTNSFNDQDLGILSILKAVFDLIDIKLNLKSAIVFFIFLFILKGVFLFFALAAIVYFRGELLSKLKLMLYDKIERMEIELFLGKNSGHFVNLVNEQTLKAINAFNALGLFLSSCLNLFVYISFAIYIEPLFAIICIFFGSFFFWMFKKLNNKVRNYSISSSGISGETSKFIIQLVNNFKYLRATNQAKNLYHKFQAKVLDQKTLLIKTGYAASLSQSLRDPLAVILMMSLIYWQVILNQNPIATLVVALALFYRSLSSLLTIQISWQKFLENSGALTLIDDEIINYKAEKNSGLKGSNFRKKISINNVTLFRDEQLILKNINLEIEKGKVTAIIGKSGSGKTTILDLLMGIISPTKGKICIDNIDLETIDKSEWRNLIGYVSQDNVIFEGSIKQNISGIGNEDEINEDKLNSVIKGASLTNFINKLNYGVDTQVGDMGIKLSGGQKQRLLIARELYREPEILILDEATSAIDSKTEQEINLSIQRLRNEFTNHNLGKTLTIIIVTHRFFNIENADQIIIVKDGKVEINGNYDHLVNS